MGKDTHGRPAWDSRAQGALPHRAPFGLVCFAPQHTAHVEMHGLVKLAGCKGTQPVCLYICGVSHTSVVDSKYVFSLNCTGMCSKCVVFFFNASFQFILQSSLLPFLKYIYLYGLERTIWNHVLKNTSFWQTTCVLLRN